MVSVGTYLIKDNLVNRRLIYNYLFNNGSASKSELVQQLQLSLPTVTRYLSELSHEHFVMEVGSIGHTGGRRAKVYDINVRARIGIGLDITRNHVTAVAINLRGDIIRSFRIRRPFEQSDNYYKYLGSVVEKIIKQANVNPTDILGVGLGVPGLCTEDHRTVYYGKILNFTGATIDEFGKYIPYPVALINDANAAITAELWINHSVRNAVYFLLSNNVGGAVVIDGQLYLGDNLHCGEIGHMNIVPNGRPCYCGKRGCVDAYCSATVLSDLTDGNLETFFQLLSQGNKEALSIWDEYLDHLVDAIVNAHVLYDSKIILGGYVGRYISDYLDELKKRVDVFNIFSDPNDFLQPCRYQVEAISAGAALIFISRFIDHI